MKSFIDWLMTFFGQISQQAKRLEEAINALVRFIKYERLETILIALGLVIIFIVRPQLGSEKLFGVIERGFIESLFEGTPITILWLQVGCVVLEGCFWIYAGIRIWPKVRRQPLEPEPQALNAVKGPMAFTPEDGPLFRKLGRDQEVARLVGHIRDDRVVMVLVVGNSGVGKTSLLRAGLTDALQDRDVVVHYWEAIPRTADKLLLETIVQGWGEGEGIGAPPQSLDELVGSADPRRHVIVLDQFEQLSELSTRSNPIFKLLRKIAQSAGTPQKFTWIIAFRKEYRGDWAEFINPEQERGFLPKELVLTPFERNKAETVTWRLLEEAGIRVDQRVVDDLLDSAKDVDGDVSPVDIGIGVLTLFNVDRVPGQEITSRMYHSVGGPKDCSNDISDRGSSGPLVKPDYRSIRNARPSSPRFWNSVLRRTRIANASAKGLPHRNWPSESRLIRQHFESHSIISAAGTSGSSIGSCLTVKPSVPILAIGSRMSGSSRPSTAWPVF